MDAARPVGATVSRSPEEGRPEEEQTEEAQTEEARTKKGGRFGWPLLLLAALLVVLVAAGIPVGLKWNDARAEQQRHGDVLTAARAEALAFTTLNHETVDADIAKVLAGATGSFKKQFAAGKAQIKELTTEAESVSSGKILAAGVVGSDSDSATVIVVADSTVTNVNLSEPQPRHYRIQLDLVLVEGSWLTSELQFVG